MTGKHVHPDNVVSGVRVGQKHASVLDVDVMIERGAILEKFFGGRDHRRVHFHHVQFQGRPMVLQPLCQRPAALSQDQATLRVRGQSQRGHHHLAVRKRQFHRIRVPHNCVKRIIEHQKAEGLLIGHAHLLIGAVFLMNRRRENQQRMESQPGQAADHPEQQSQSRRVDPPTPPEPAQSQDHQRDAQHRDQGQTSQPRQEVKRRSPGADQAADGRDRNHGTGMTAQMAHVGNRQSQQGG